MANLVEMIYNIPVAVTVDLDEGYVYRVQELGDLIFYDAEKPMIKREGDYELPVEGEMARDALNIAETEEWPVRD